MQPTVVPQPSLTVRMFVAQTADLGTFTGLPSVAASAGMGVAIFNMLATIQHGKIVFRDLDAPVGLAPALGWLLLTVLLGVGTWVLITLLSQAIKGAVRRRRGIPEAFSQLDVPVTVSPQGLEIEGLGVTPWTDITRVYEGNDDDGTMYVYCTGHYDLILRVQLLDREKLSDLLRIMRAYAYGGAHGSGPA